MRGWCACGSAVSSPSPHLWYGLVVSHPVPVASVCGAAWLPPGPNVNRTGKQWRENQQAREKGREERERGGGAMTEWSSKKRAVPGAVQGSAGA